MIEKMMKAVKRSNKRRSVNITIGAVVGFLLSCTSVMGAAIDIKGDGTDFKVTTAEITGNTFENNIYINNGEIKPAQGSGGVFLSGTSSDNKLSFVNNGTIEVQSHQGIRMDSSIDVEGEIINNGTITSTSSTYGDGISIAGTLTTADEIAIENNGTIDTKRIGINIANGAVVTGNIINNGSIKSKAAAIELMGEGTIKVINTGILKSENVIASIDIEKKINIEKITNDGVIENNGESSTRGASAGIYATISKIGDIENNGIIKNKSIESSNNTSDEAIYIANDAIIGKIENKGSLIAKGGKNSLGIVAYGGSIYNYGHMGVDGKLGVGIQGKDTSGIANNGNIRVGGSTESKGISIIGTSKFYNDGLVNSGNGIGLSVGSGVASSGNFNQGVIYGKVNAIKNEGTIGLTNYGLLIKEGENGTNILLGTDFNTITNYGLAFSVKANGNYFLNDTNKQTYINKDRTVIIAKSFEGTTSGEITGTESILSSLLTTDSTSDYGNTNYRYIITGITDTLKINDKDKKLGKTSIINAYKRAMVMEKDSELTAEQTTFNGGVDGKSETIYLAGNNSLNLSGNSIINGNTKIDGTGNTFSMDASIQNGDIEANSGSNTLSLKNGSIMNGDITAEGDNNNLNIDESILNGNVAIDGDGNTLNISEKDTYINGNLAAANGKNTINFTGDSVTGDNLNMFHEVTGFNEMNIKGGSVTFFEDSKVTGTEKVTIAEDGTLNLRLKKTGTQTGTGLNEATHAFTDNGEMVMVGAGDGGNLKFITSGIGEGVWIDINDMQIKNMHIDASSAIDGHYKVEEDGGLVIKAAEDLEDMQKLGDKIEDSKNQSGNNPGGDSGDDSGDNPSDNPSGDSGDSSNIFDEENFESINGIYKGIRSSANKNDNLDALRNVILFDRNSGAYDDLTSKEEQLKNLQAYLNEIYTQSPYALSSELSRKSAGMFRDIVVENIFRPNLNKWMIMGGLTHIDGGTKDTYYGEVYEMDGKNSSSTNVDTKLTGAYALGKYGYSENVTLGVTIGGNRSEAELSRSKVKGNSGYIGAFAENYRGNLTLKAGAGVQYSEYDSSRSTIGGYSYSDKYSDMAYDIYLTGRYSNPVGENLFLEPYATLSYTYVDQEGTDEGNKALAITTDSKSFDYTAAKVGVDLKKVIPHEKGKSTLSAGASYTRLLNGADVDSLTGSYKGGSDFDIMVASKNEHSVGLNAKYALEMESGVLFDVKGSYSFERDSHNGNARNKNKGEWIVGAGLGYKF